MQISSANTTLPWTVHTSTAISVHHPRRIAGPSPLVHGPQVRRQTKGLRWASDVLSTIYDLVRLCNWPTNVPLGIIVVATQQLAQVRGSECPPLCLTWAPQVSHPLSGGTGPSRSLWRSCPDSTSTPLYLFRADDSWIPFMYSLPGPVGRLPALAGSSHVLWGFVVSQIRHPFLFLSTRSFLLQLSLHDWFVTFIYRSGPRSHGGLITDHHNTHLTGLLTLTQLRMLYISTRFWRTNIQLGPWLPEEEDQNGTNRTNTEEVGRMETTGYTA